MADLPDLSDELILSRSLKSTSSLPEVDMLAVAVLLLLLPTAALPLHRPVELLLFVGAHPGLMNCGGLTSKSTGSRGAPYSPNLETECLKLYLDPIGQ